MTIEKHPVDPYSSAKERRFRACEFDLRVFSKYDDATTKACGPTLSIAISHALPDLRHLAHSRAVFGARLQPEFGSSYGSWGIWFPDRGERPPAGYDHFSVRHAIEFDDKLEVFDVLAESDQAEGVLRYRAQELGDDDKSIQIIIEGVRRYLDAAHQVMLWDPKAKLDIREGLTDLFLDRDWTPFVSVKDLEPSPVAITDIQLVSQVSVDEWLVRFHYVNGESSGYELEFADVKRGKLKIRRDAYSALRSAVPAFRGDQLGRVYEALQSGIDAA